MSSFRCVSYNIHSGVGTDDVYDLPRVAEALNSLSPDIIGLQECDVNSSFQQTRVWSKAHGDDQIAELARRTGLDYSAFAPAITSRAESNTKETHGGVGDGEFGIGILSRWPIVEQRTMMFRPYKNKTPRNALACLIRVPNLGDVWFVCTHLGCHWGAEQAAQVDELIPWLANLPTMMNGDDNSSGSGSGTSLILVGDTNSLPFWSAIRTLRNANLGSRWGGLRDTASLLGLGYRGTFPALGLPCCFSAVCFPPIFQLDYCFIAEHSSVRPTASFVAGPAATQLVASDHRPIVIDFGANNNAIAERAV
jgi:endonuclease/exonuclease/phosphatase family metal-dependent hydrolase